MLITPQKLATLKPEQITKIMLAQVKQLYPTGNVAHQIAADLGVDRATWFNWKSKHTVPWSVVLLFQEWIAKQKEPAPPPDPLAVAASEMGKAARIMAEAMQGRADAETG